jgi:hypothetical protein
MWPPLRGLCARQIMYLRTNIPPYTPATAAPAAALVNALVKDIISRVNELDKQLFS